MSKRFIISIVIIIAAIGGIIWLTSDKAGAPTGTDNAQTTNHLYGEGKKGVTLVEYGDFECPACGAYYPIVKQLKEDYKADITFQFRNYPLTQKHPNAFAAHRAAEAASKQGKFWEMHNMLYEGQQTWGSGYGYSQNAAIATFNGYAANLGLNMDQFKADYASADINNMINADIKAGQALNAVATPTFVLNGKKIEDNPRDIDSFKKLIDDAIKEKSTATQ